MRPPKSVLWRCFTFLGERGEAITEVVSWDSLLLPGFRSQVPLGFKGEKKQGKFDWMGLFVGTARLNACHSLPDQLGSAESPIGVDQYSCQIPRQTHKYTDTYFRTFTSADTEYLHFICISFAFPNFPVWLLLLPNSRLHKFTYKLFYYYFFFPSAKQCRHYGGKRDI